MEYDYMTKPGIICSGLCYILTEFFYESKQTIHYIRDKDWIA